MTLVGPPSPATPLQVTIVGSSVAMMVVPPAKDREAGTYGELLPALLAQRGVPARVDAVTRWFGMIHELRHEFERIRDLHPHVVVLHFGFLECQPHVVPTWLVRHFTSWDASSLRPAVWYRRHLAHRLWRGVRGWQRWAARRDRSRTHRLSPRRFRTELEHLIRLLRRQRPLVLVLDIDPPGGRVLRWLPGLDRRVERYNTLLAETVAAFDDPEVRLVRAGDTIGDRGAELLPDGLHRNAEGHRLTADLLGEEIVRWLGTLGLTDRHQDVREQA